MNRIEAVLLTTVRSCASLRALGYCVLASVAMLGCVRTVQAWPPPLSVGTPVTIRLSGPRRIVFEGEAGRDSVAGVSELQGRVISLHGDTVVIRVTRAPQAGQIVGRQATILLDSATIVTRSEVDSWKVGYGILATAVLIFAGLFLSGG